MGTVLMGFWLLPSSGILETRPRASEICGQGECGRILTCVFYFLIATLLLRLTFSMVGHCISRSVRVVHLAVLTDLVASRR